MDEALYYNAVAAAARGDYQKIGRCRAAASDWKEAYHVMHASGTPLPDPREAWHALEKSGISLILRSDETYPLLLREISQPPFGLYVRGSLASLRRTPMLAVVGTRRASPEGKRTARDFSRSAAAAGATIVSGLAFGIDAAAHEGCLDADAPTVAVLAGGLDGIYPRSHEALARRIVDRGGALVSEYPPGEAPFAYRFIERNRIVSGMAQAVLIVEAPEGSGALATARFAGEENRELFVVPGPVSSSNFKGSHALIRQGAELVAAAEHIIEGLDIRSVARTLFETSGASPEETLILKALKEVGAPADVDKLSEITRLEPRIINRTLSFLIIRGMAREAGDGYTI